MRAVVLCLVCATTACSAAPLNLGFGVAVTATFDGTVTDDALAQVTQLVFSASGDEMYEADQQLSRAANRVETFVYRPLDSTRRLGLDIAAEDADGNAIAAGSSAQIQLAAGETSQLQITLFPKALPDAGPGDGTMPDFTLPAGAGDGSGPLDLSAVPFPLCSGASVGSLCLDFEGPFPSTWTLVQDNATATVATEYAHSGTHALHIHLDSVASAMSANGSVTETATFATAATMFHARAFFYFPSAPPAENVIPMFVAQQTTTPFATMDFELNDTHYAMYDSFATTTNYTETTSSFPTGVWTCVEWTVQIASAGAMTLTVNNTTLSANEIHDTTSSTPPLGLIAIGGQLNNTSTQASPVVDFWMDDVVVSTTAISCNEN